MRLNIVKKNDLIYFGDSVLNSYTQIFFSTYRPFALLIILVSFFDYYAGLMGLLAVVTTSVTAFSLNLDKPTTARGLYGFNSLLVGLGLGIYYSVSWYLFFIVILAAIFTLFISVTLQGFFGKYHLPYLSIPFLIALWIFTLASRSFEALGISDRGIYTFNDLYTIGGPTLINIYEWFQTLQIPTVLRIYFISLSAILFQYNVLGGMLIAIGLLFFSRIAFSLSVIGFMVAFGFYQMIEANITAVDYSYIGFNYILTSIAVGGFFLIPSPRSYLSVVVLTPLVAIVTISFNAILVVFRLPIYSLPFNLIVLLFLYVLKFRMAYSYRLSEVFYQFNAPEKNLYTFINNKERFRYHYLVPLKLPFFGTWQVSQGHNGAYTHQKEWRHAWDFIVVDSNGKQFRAEGNYPEDYYCFNKPVVAPEKGFVEAVMEDIEDNVIGEVNLRQNWGNTVVLKHSEGVYSKLSHLKKGSIMVKKGDAVEFGQIIGRCGNSGRSPYPHLHLQIQTHPHIGSVTMDYPISHYMSYQEGKVNFRTYQKPLEGDLVSNVEVNPLLDRAFHFVPGQQLAFDVTGHSRYSEFRLDVKVNPYNQSYMECRATGARAYFESDHSQFYFTQYEGSRDSLLHALYLAALKVQKGFYKELVLTDQYPLHHNFPSAPLWFHDFISPFIRLISSRYQLTYKTMDDPLAPSEIQLQVIAENTFLNWIFSRQFFDLTIRENGLSLLTIRKANQLITLKQINDYET